jgi:hypothetical protein
MAQIAAKVDADPRMTAWYAHVVDMAKKNPALFIPVNVGKVG